MGVFSKAIKSIKSNKTIKQSLRKEDMNLYLQYRDDLFHAINEVDKKYNMSGNGPSATKEDFDEVVEWMETHGYWDEQIESSRKVIKSSRIGNILKKNGIEVEDDSQAISCPYIDADNTPWKNINMAKLWLKKHGVGVFGWATPDGMHYYGFENLTDEEAQSYLDEYESTHDEDDDDWSDLDCDICVTWY